MIRASIDLGTNTCLLLVADFDPKSGQVVRVIHDQSTMVRLGQGVDKTRELHADAIERTRACLRGYASKLIQLGLKPSQTVAVATATARDARNGAAFFSGIERELGFHFRTISGDDEAKYMFLGGLLPGMKPESSVVIDIGGGSTELKSIGSGMSLQMGSVRFTERYLKSDPATDEEFWACEAAIDEMFERAHDWRAGLGYTTKESIQLVGVAGTVVTLAQWHLGQTAFDPSALNEVRLTRGDVHRMVEELKWRTVAERKAVPGIEAGRADVLLAGALILWRAMERLSFPDLRVSTRGLRYGVLALGS